MKHFSSKWGKDTVSKWSEERATVLPPPPLSPFTPNSLFIRKSVNKRDKQYCEIEACCQVLYLDLSICGSGRRTELELELVLFSLFFYFNQLEGEGGSEILMNCGGRLCGSVLFLWLNKLLEWILSGVYSLRDE